MNPMRKLRALVQHHFGTEELLALSRDLYASEVFHDRIRNSPWFVRQQLSPGHYAADYGFLKTLYNVLSAMRPCNILEFGLGQSSKLVHQYATYFHAEAVTCENNDDWITFFFQNETASACSVQPNPKEPVLIDESLGYPIKIRRLPLEKTKVNNVLTTTYADIESTFRNQRFDLILVDGPYGEERYSRPQIIPLAEVNLSDRFCILMDDTQRLGEQETLAAVEAVLHRRDIPFVSATLQFSKSHTLILSPSLKYLATS